jgi:hypothetical protein
MLRDPEHIKELMEIKVKAGAQSNRGRPISKPISNSQQENSDWMKQCSPFDLEQVNEKFPIKQLFDREMNEILMNDLINKEQVIKLISPWLRWNNIPFLNSKKNL